jgi:hypothetical protein
MSNKPMIDTVVMSGGAPQSPLMAGFLYELLSQKKSFKNFHTSGAGALMALLLIAPKCDDPRKALKGWVEAGVSDEIYAGLPVNFKLFHKPGPFSTLTGLMAQRLKMPLKDAPSRPEDPFRDLLAEWLASKWPKPAGSPTDRDGLDRFQERLAAIWSTDPDPNTYDQLRKRTDPIKRMRDRWLGIWLKSDKERRIYNDLVDLWFSAITPSTLTPKSKGLAAPLPFLEDLVCFKTLKNPAKFKGHLCVNAYNMTADANLDNKTRRDREKRNAAVMEIFDQTVIDGDHIRAAFSMPFIYPPARIGDSFYSEGADHQPINFHDLPRRNGPNNGPIKVALLDVLADLEDLLVRTPRDLWDAYVISIMTPVVALAHEDISDFEDAKRKHGVELVHADWNIPHEFRPYVMDWSYSNLERLFEAGQEAGADFLKNHDAPNYKDVFGRDLQ